MSDARSPTLGLLALLALGVNGIVGVGIFFAPAEVAAHVPGLDGVAVYAATAIALAPVAVVYATLGATFREDGGPYVWARAAFGPRLAYVVGFVAYVSALFSTATVVSGLGRFAAPALGLGGPVASRVFVVGVVVVLSAIVASGLRPSAATWTAITFLKLTPLVLLAAVALVTWSVATEPAPPSAGSAPARVSLDAWGRAALAVVFASQGFEIVPILAGKVAKRWIVPVATVGSLALATALYLVLHVVCVRALPNLSASAAPLAEAARVHGGSLLHGVVSVGTNVSAVGIAFGMFAMTPRYLLVLGAEDALGSWAGTETTSGVPARALMISSSLVLMLVLVGRLDELFVLSSVSVLAQYAVAAASLALLAVRRRGGLGPHAAWASLASLVAIVVVGRAAKWTELAVTAAAVGVGALLLACRRAWR